MKQSMVVVGAGAFGSWTALLAARAGYQVTLLDAYGPGNDRSSSSGESRIIRSAYGSDEIYTVMARRSLAAWTGLFSRRQRSECFRQTGVLWLAHESEPGIQAARQIFARQNIACEWLSSADLNRRFPQMQVDNSSVGLFEPEAGALIAAESVCVVRDAAVESGATYCKSTVQVPDESLGRLDCVLDDEGERVKAEVYVFACGSWLPTLLPEALRHRIFPTRQELFFFETQAELAPNHQPVWIDQTDERMPYGFPNLDGAGAKVAFHRLGPPFDPEAGSREVTTDQIDEAAHYLRQRFPALRDLRIRSTRVCPYENTSNGDLLIDRHPHVENVWMLGGGSGHGFKHAPAVAECALQAISKQQQAEPRFRYTTKQTALNRAVY